MATTTMTASTLSVGVCLILTLLGEASSFAVPASESQSTLHSGRISSNNIHFGAPGSSSSSRRYVLSPISASEEHNVPDADPTSSAADDAIEDDDPTIAPVKPRTKRQIAKLMYVMVKDVEDLIRSSDPSRAPAKALDNIDRLEYLADETGDESYRANAALYNALVRAHAKSGLDGAAEAAEAVLDEMKYRANEEEDGGGASGGEGGGGPLVRPDVTTYTAVIDAYARSKDAGAAVQAERILYGMMDDAEEAAAAAEAGEKNAHNVVLPTSVTCDAVMNAWARRRTREGAEHAERILERMEYLRTSAKGGGSIIRPTTYSFSTVIKAWKFGVGGAEAAERAEKILERMIDMADKADRAKRRREGKGNDDDTDGDDADDGTVRPNTVVFNSVIDSWSRSGDPAAGTRAEELLVKMEEMCKGGKEDVKPDEITYNSVINAWSNCGHMNAAKSAERVLEKMEAASPDVRPNTRTYNSLIKAWSKSTLPGAPQRASDILSSMIEAHGVGNADVCPDVISFSTVLDAWAKSQEPGKAQEAKLILGDMLEFWMKSGDDAAKPNAFAYNAVLNACAFSAMAPDGEERKRALLIAVATFNEMRTAGFARPDTVTYGMMLKCIANLVPVGATRENMATQLFKKCCEDGLVGDLVLNELKRSVSPGTLDGLMEGHIKPRRRNHDRFAVGGVGFHIGLADLPKEWKSNVRDKRRRRRQQGSSGIQKRTSKRGSSSEKNESTDREGGGAKPTTVRIVETSWQSGRDV